MAILGRLAFPIADAINLLRKRRLLLTGLFNQEQATT
jgi:hypothetical protein